MNEINQLMDVGDAPNECQDQLRQLVEEIAEMANRSGSSVVAHQPASWVYFESLPNLRKREILQYCRCYHAICENTLAEGRALSDTKALLWSSLKYFGFIPCSDLMERITDDLVVELYDKAGRQVFRNFKFMEVCSYTLADVLLYQWWELFERNDEIVNQLLSEVAIVLAGPAARTILSATPVHETTEIFSERKHRFQMKFEMLSPIRSRLTKKSAGFVCTAQAKLVSVQSNRSRPAAKPELRVIEAEVIS